MENAGNVLVTAHHLYARADSSEGRPPIYKVVGLCLAIASGLFIGVSFVLKKIGLLKANVKYHEEAGEGYGYLKNAWWWTGMTLMIVGEICNFVAYAFVDAILVTPLGALSVVVTTILSAIFLKERLSFVGKVGCFNCIIGSVVIVINAPEQSAVADIQGMKKLVLAPGFLSYAGAIIVICTFIALWAGPRYGKKTMMVYLSICSLIGGLSVVATQGLGAAVVAQAGGKPQFNQWFLYVVLVFVVSTLLTEIIYLNKALNLFNAALVTPTYYVFFTSATIVTSAVLFQGFHGTAATISTVVMGFLQICSGVILLQLSKSAKDVPDTAVFKGDLDQVRTVAEQEEPEYEPRADTIRGGAAILRSLSTARHKREAEEAKHIHEERMEPINEGEVVEWDGLRRRKTIVGTGQPSPGIQRTKTIHPPLGMSHFPDFDADQSDNESMHPGFFNRLRSLSRAKHDQQQPTSPVPLEGLPSQRPQPSQFPSSSTGASGAQSPRGHVYGLPASLRHVDDDGDTSYKPHESTIHWSQEVLDGAEAARKSHNQSGSSLAPPPPPHAAKRQFSFQNVFHRNKSSDGSERAERPLTSRSYPSFSSRKSKGTSSDGATEEERLGLVKGDSRVDVDHDSDGEPKQHDEPSPPDYSDGEEEWQLPRKLGDQDSQVSPGVRSAAMTPKRRKSDEDEDDGHTGSGDIEKSGAGATAGRSFV